jgi:hypothetical protein
MPAQITSVDDDTTKPVIFLLSLDDDSLFDKMYSRLIDAVATRATITRATKPAAALNFLSANNPKAIFITDPALVDAANSAVLQRVTSYVRGGGTAVIGGSFSGWVQPQEIGNWFSSQWGLTWKFGSYHGDTVYLNPLAQRVPHMGLPAAYSQKAIFLKDVGSNASWYLTPKYTDEESGEQLVDTQETPVAFTLLGSGWLGYVGDVNAEEGSDAVILAMFGLL